jgi:hypothetical protein
MTMKLERLHSSDNCKLRHTRTLAATLVLGAVMLCCGSQVKQEGIEKILGAMSTDQRRSSFEDTSKVLDQHPDWIDDFYLVARKHPALMRRFLANAARDLKEPELAGVTADLLTNEPASTEQMLKSTVDASVSKPEARKAIDRAVASRSEVMADIMSDDPATMDAVMAASIAVARRKPKAKQALVQAMNHHAAQVVEFAASDPKLMSAMARPVLEAALKDKDSLIKLLKELKIL